MSVGFVLVAAVGVAVMGGGMADFLADLVDVRPTSPGVALVTLNLPQVRNAMTRELTSAWVTAMDQIAENGSLRAVVVTGAGSAFCSGADLSWLEQGDLSDTTPDRAAEQDAALLPGLAGSTSHLGASDRGRERPGNRSGTVPGPSL
jgi:1,4-dihydroxy-2-naphthoyl-CoA synthase